MNLHVSMHAIERYQERVSNVPDEEARAALTSPTVHKAAEIGAPFVKLGTGQRIVLQGNRVVTVLPIDTWAGSLDPMRDNLHERRT